MPDEASDRPQALLAGLTTLVLLAGMALLARTFASNRRRAPEPPPHVPVAKPYVSEPLILPVPRPRGQAPAARTHGQAPTAPEPVGPLAGVPWDALGVALLKYGIGPKPQGPIPPQTAALLGDWQTRLDRLAREKGLPDAQAASYLPEVRDRLSFSLLGAVGTALTEEQKEAIRAFDREAYSEAWRKEAFRISAPPLERAVRVLEAQERYEGFLKTVIPGEDHAAYLAALGDDPLRNERIPVETVSTADPVQALVERWDRAFGQAVPEATLRAKAAETVARMRQAEPDRAGRRLQLRAQVEAEAFLCPVPSAGSARALRFVAP